MRLRRLATLGLLVASFTAIVLPAQGCSLAGSLPLRLGLEEGFFDRDGGIYQQETVARVPSILIRDEATASVVTLYWGRPPANLGVQFERGGWFSWVTNPFNVDSCSDVDDGIFYALDGTVGTIGYGYAPPPENATGPLSPEEAAAQGTVPWHRMAPDLPLDNGNDVGPLSAAELELLEATYGPATEVDHPISTYIWATVTIWWPTVIGLAVTASVIAVIMSLILLRRNRDKAESPSTLNA